MVLFSGNSLFHITYLLVEVKASFLQNLFLVLTLTNHCGKKIWKAGFLTPGLSCIDTKCATTATLSDSLGAS